MLGGRFVIEKGVGESWPPVRGLVRVPTIPMEHHVEAAAIAQRTIDVAVEG
jgi:hypothetical protein